ncbi:MAG TPA: PQQ-binding-like beta-propeller repeat protein [Solirubrobacterales bacterium]|nr:PQQ-binding-like beta-propeller repeat protein [Solirubrobacterales bacterium]
MALRINSPTRGLLALLGLLAVLALAGCGGSGDDSSSGGGNATAAARQVVETEPGPDDWPFFGRVPQRTHYLPEPEKPLDPPFKQVWSFNTHALIEFPPAIANGVAYVVNKYGNPAAIRLSDRKVIWERKTKENLHGAPLTVTGPAYHEGHVYYASLGGYLISVAADDGHIDWIHDTHSHLESSPLVVGDTLYVGTDKAKLLAVDIADGHVRWSFSAPGAIKASPSYDHGRIYVADYQSSVYAVDAKTGKPIWRTNTSKVAPFGKGGFFSSPAISFGRVYVGRDDGTIYAFDEKTGKVDWTFPTGASVYGSPAPAAVAGTKPTVYVGSESGIFYALDAATGKPHWKYDVGGPVPGSATVIGHTVFTSSFKTRKTVGIDVRDHRKVFFLRQAGYTPMISDGRKLYLVGYYTVTALQPTGN